MANGKITEKSSLIKVEKHTTLKVGGTDVKFVLFHLLRPLSDDGLKQSEIKRLVQTENPEFMPLSGPEVDVYAQNCKPNKPLFALYSWGYGTPQSGGGLVGTREIQPNGEVEFREHWCLGGDSFQWITEITFIMKVCSNYLT